MVEVEADGGPLLAEVEANVRRALACVHARPVLKLHIEWVGIRA
jgi:hypothetical protein